MSSLAMRGVALALRAMHRPSSATTATARARLAVQQPQSMPPVRLANRHRVVAREVGGFTVFSVAPRTRAVTGGVLYLHGGAFVAGMAPQHWALVSRLVDAGLRVDVPDYGLAPRHTAADALPFVVRAYRDLRGALGDLPVHVAGDSAGGGLALILIRALADAGAAQPDRLVMIAPWLDLALTNPAIADVDDPWLSRPALVEYGRAWAGRGDVDDWRATTMDGPLEAVPPTWLYVGTRDIATPDALRWADRARASGVAVSVDLCPGAVHVYPLVPAPEGRRARRAIVDVLASRVAAGP